MAYKQWNIFTFAAIGLLMITAIFFSENVISNYVVLGLAIIVFTALISIDSFREIKSYKRKILYSITVSCLTRLQRIHPD